MALVGLTDIQKFLEPLFCAQVMRTHRESYHAIPAARHWLIAIIV
jgi:hypothetical protein